MAPFSLPIPRGCTTPCHVTVLMLLLYHCPSKLVLSSLTNVWFRQGKRNRERQRCKNMRGKTKENAKTTKASLVTYFTIEMLTEKAPAQHFGQKKTEPEMRDEGQKGSLDREEAGNNQDQYGQQNKSWHNIQSKPHMLWQWKRTYENKLEKHETFQYGVNIIVFHVFLCIHVDMYTHHQ